MGSIGKESKRFSFSGRLKSFGNAFSGLNLLLKNEHNFRIHIFILILVIIAGISFRLSAVDWMAIATVSGLVLIAESFNTAIEYLSDAVTSELNPEIKKAKDTAAAGVLISALIAVVAGLIIFIPEIIEAVKAAGKN